MFQVKEITRIEEVHDMFKSYHPATLVASTTQTLLFHLEKRRYANFISCDQALTFDFNCPSGHYILIEDVSSITPVLSRKLNSLPNEIVALRYKKIVDGDGPSINSLEHVSILKGGTIVDLCMRLLVNEFSTCAVVIPFPLYLVLGF
jgi:hypothetical protein